MSFSEDNLDTACTYSENAYDDNIVGATKIECERTSTTAFVHRTPHLDIVVFEAHSSSGTGCTTFSASPDLQRQTLPRGFRQGSSFSLAGHQKTPGPAKKLLICGHSLGGALAELSAWSCKEFQTSTSSRWASQMCFSDPPGGERCPG